VRVSVVLRELKSSKELLDNAEFALKDFEYLENVNEQDRASLRAELALAMAKLDAVAGSL